MFKVEKIAHLLSHLASLEKQEKQHTRQSFIEIISLLQIEINIELCRTLFILLI